jgi:drug/metabolite transporter (DMT)-like permease
MGHNILRGILFMCAASAIFPVMNAMAKHLSAELPTVEIVWARNVGHLVFVVLLFWPRFGRRLAATRRLKSQVLRSCLFLGSNIFFFTAIAAVPLAEAAAITFVSPFLVAIIAAAVLGERVGPGHWLAILTGFAGALIIIRPGSGELPWQAVLLLASSLCYATYQVLTRGVAGDDSPETSVFYASLVGSLLTTLAVPFVWTTPASVWTVAQLASLGVLGGLGHYCVARAMMWGPAPVISPFQYFQLVAASIFGYAVFGDVPSPWTGVGAVVIVASGVAIALLARRDERARIEREKRVG